ncbi:MAG: type I-C CRISPR-associated protein Cas8c/Csd1 [Chloroflexi bacterium]|nr:type I-C CRISPR-associated protein Cas8c/Csd1 [Chloroflexota bacterium]
MVLQDLAEHYNVLLQDEHTPIAKPGYSPVNINFLINLSSSGELLDLIKVLDRQVSGKKIIERPRRILLPEATIRAGIKPKPNLLWDNTTYIFGLEESDKGGDYSRVRFTAFREHNLKFLKPIDCPEARALEAFLRRYSAADFLTLPPVREKLEDLSKATGFLTFQFDDSQQLISDAPAIVHALQQNRTSSAASKVIGQCLITGNLEPIAVLHPNIQGVKDVNSTGGSIVSFNERAYESYGKVNGQGLNAPVSEAGAFAYTTALNYLLSRENPFKKFQLGGATVVYWAESASPVFANVFQQLFDPQLSEDTPQSAQSAQPDRDMQQILQSIASKISQGLPVDLSAVLKNQDPTTKFHVLGLSPNSARISIRFYETAPFESLIARILQHHADINMGQTFPWSVWRILNETVSPKSSDKEPAPLLGGAVLRSILTGQPYPAALYHTILNRVRIDNDDQKTNFRKISPLRAGLIKGCLIRNARHQRHNKYSEVLTMSLNPTSTNQPYLLGRLFAILEKAQVDAVNPGATIKDRYFTSACANPASTFPVLLRLSQHHIAKSQWGWKTERGIGEVMELLDIDNHPFPRRLNLEDQGLFILGYYHQRTDIYTARTTEASQTPLSESQLSQNSLFEPELGS